ncbi:MAG: ATP-grasp domain-containing protein [Balneolaceae bacterium]
MSLKKPALVCSEIGLVHCLGAAGIPALTGTENHENSALYSRYSKMRILFSSYESVKFIDELCELSKKLEYKPVLLSYDDRLILNISRNREKLSKYFSFLLPDIETVENILDKKKFIELSEEFQLPVPASIQVSEKKDLKQATEKLKTPYIIKPFYRHHWFHKDFLRIVGAYKKAFICNSFRELQEYYDRIARINPNVVVQDFIAGPDNNMYDVNMYIDADGEVQGCLICKKLRVYPQEAGYGSYAITVDDKEISDLCHQISSKLKLRGLINIQFKRDAETLEPKLIEIHARTSIFDVLGIKAGTNIPALYYSDMTGKNGALNGKSKTGIKYINIGRDLRFILKNHNKTDFTFPELVKSYFGTKVIDGFSFRDPIPAVMNIWWLMRHSLINRRR